MTWTLMDALANGMRDTPLSAYKGFGQDTHIQQKQPLVRNKYKCDLKYDSDFNGYT